MVCLMGECCVVSGHWLDHSVLSKLKDLFKVSSRVRWVENLRPLCGGGTSKLNLPQPQRLKTTKTHLSKKENQALVLQTGPKAGSADPEAKI